VEEGSGYGWKTVQTKEADAIEFILSKIRSSVEVRGRSDPAG
jgi:hypothetical protein